MIRRMIGFRKREEEGVESYMRRAESVVTAAIEAHRIIPWDVYARRLVFKWSGWVARLQIFDKERLTLAVARHKNLKWLQTIKAANRGRELHGRYLKVWRWESLVFSFFKENFPGEEWEQVAQDAERWRVIVGGVF